MRRVLKSITLYLLASVFIALCVSISDAQTFYPIGLTHQIATLEDCFTSSSGNVRLLCIEDPLMEPRSQNHLARMIERMVQSEKIHVVLQEAATADASLSYLAKKADRAKILDSVRDYLDRGLLSGAEAASLRSKNGFELEGAEDPASYDKALRAYAALLGRLDSYSRFDKYLSNALENLKRRIFNSALLDFLHTREAFWSGGSSFASYGHWLESQLTAAEKDKLSVSSQTHFATLNLLFYWERDLDLKAIDRELELLLSKLDGQAKREFYGLGFGAMKSFKVSVDSEDGRIRLFQQLRSQITDEQAYPKLIRYLNYLDQFTAFPKSEIKNECRIIEGVIVGRYIQNSDERRLYEIDTNVSAYRRFVSLNLSEEEYRRMNRKPENVDLNEAVRFLNNKIAAGLIPGGKLLKTIPRSEQNALNSGVRDFYRATFRRHKAFISEVGRRLSESKNDEYVIFVFSSYHTPELKRLLREKGISYLLLKPTMSRTVSQDNFYAKTLLEQIFMSRPSVDSLHRDREPVQVIERARPFMLWPVKTRLLLDLLYGRKPIFLSLLKDLNLQSREHLKLLLKAVDDAVPSLKGSSDVLPASTLKMLGGRLSDLAMGAPGLWRFSKETDDYVTTAKNPLSYAWFVETVRSIEQEYDTQKYRAFKSFVNDKSPEFHGESFRQKLRSFEKTLILALAKMEVRNLNLVESLKARAKKPEAVAERMAALKILTSLPMAYGAFWSWETPPDPRKVSIRVPHAFYPDTEDLKKVLVFLKTNLTESGMPLSYKSPKEYWKSYQPGMDSVDTVLERLIVEHSLSIYDAACWQIVLSFQPDVETERLINLHTARLLQGSSGDLREIKAYSDPFFYGEQKRALSREHAYFFRIIADRYLQDDPGQLGNSLPNFPNFSAFHHEDWKPITGEQAWAAIIGPLQVAYRKYGANIPVDCDEMKLAVNIIPAFEAMQSKIGAIYHAPYGTHQKSPYDISNENNCSVYAALKMLKEALRGRDADLGRRIDKLLKGQEDYFRRYAFDRKNEVFYQGGFYEKGKFIPTRIFAVDCQTWGTIVLGKKWIDQNFGEGTAYRIWQNTKQRAGFFDHEGVLRGVGFSDGHKILSGEWTCGAILATKLMAKAYRADNPLAARDLEKDMMLMRYGVEMLKSPMNEYSLSYLYANARHFMPFGWWANPIPSLISSVWVVMIDTGYNPFVLGGGPDFNAAKTLQDLKPLRTSGDTAEQYAAGISMPPPVPAISAVKPKAQPSKPNYSAPNRPYFVYAPRPLLQHDMEEKEAATRERGIYQLPQGWDLRSILIILCLSGACYSAFQIFIKLKNPR